MYVVPAAVAYPIEVIMVARVWDGYLLICLLLPLTKVEMVRPDGPREESQPHLPTAASARSLRMEEPCLHVPLDHVHEGREVVVVALCVKD